MIDLKSLRIRFKKLETILLVMMEKVVAIQQEAFGQILVRFVVSLGTGHFVRTL